MSTDEKLQRYTLQQMLELAENMQFTLTNKAGRQTQSILACHHYPDHRLHLD